MKNKRICAFALAGLLLCSTGIGYVTATAEDKAIDFAGIISESDDGFVYKNYYINENEWLIGDNVTQPKYNDAQQKDYLRFLDCGNRTVFGPRVRYEDFVCRFSVIMDDIELASSGASLGISFNRGTLYSFANDCPGFLFVKAEAGTAVRATQGQMDKAETGTLWLQYKEENAIDLWSEKGKKYDFMVIKSGDEAQLYFAEAGDTESMKILRATVSGVSGDGFVAACGIMGANFYLDSFAVHELSPQSGEDLSSYSVNGAAAVSGGVGVIGHGGSLVSAKKNEKFAVTYDVKVVGGNSFTLDLDGKFINISSDGRIFGSEGLTLSSGGNVDFSLFENGTSVRLRRLNGKVYVDVKEGTVYETKAVFEEENAAQTKYGITAGADASLIVNSVSVASLEATIDIATHNYDPNVDLEPIRPKDVSFNEYYGIKD